MRARRFSLLRRPEELSVPSVDSSLALHLIAPGLHHARDYCLLPALVRLAVDGLHAYAVTYLERLEDSSSDELLGRSCLLGFQLLLLSQVLFGL